MVEPVVGRADRIESFIHRPRTASNDGIRAQKARVERDFARIEAQAAPKSPVRAEPPAPPPRAPEASLRSGDLGSNIDLIV